MEQRSIWISYDSDQLHYSHCNIKLTIWLVLFQFPISVISAKQTFAILPPLATNDFFDLLLQYWAISQKFSFANDTIDRPPWLQVSRSAKCGGYPATTEGGLFNNRTGHVYRRLQVDLKRSKPEAIVAIVVSIVATTFSIVATFFTIVATFVKMLKTRSQVNSSNIFSQ